MLRSRIMRTAVLLALAVLLAGVSAAPAYGTGGAAAESGAASESGAAAESGAASASDAASGAENADIYAVAEGIVAWEREAAGGGFLLSGDFLEYAGSSAGDWFPFGFGRLGVLDDYESYLASLSANIEARYLEDGKLDASKATEWHRASLAMLAAGGDPTRAGETGDGQAINLIADGVYDRGRTEAIDEQGVNGLIWGLIALDSFRYKVPADAFTNRSGLVAAILASQLPDGSFALDDKNGDIDITAMAVTALAPYYNSDEKFGKGASARAAVDAALGWLSARQLDDGDFTSWGDPNSESAAQAITALCALGIDPDTDARFVKDGGSVLDGLMKYRMDDGGFAHTLAGETAALSDSMASEQALYAITALLRLRNDRRGLFDFRPEMDDETRSRVESLEDGIAQLPEEAGASGAKTVRALLLEYSEIPAGERSYVYGYRRLADAADALGISYESEPLSIHMEINEGGAGTMTDVRTGEDIRPELESMYRSAAETKAEIESINSGVMAKLYPFSDISLGDRDELKGYIARIERLDESDRARVAGYEELLKADKRLAALSAVRVALIAACAVGVALALLIIIRRRKRREGRHG